MNMKMVYERPVMHAEMYMTNAYCATGCTIGGSSDQVGMKGVTLNQGEWHSINSGLGGLGGTISQTGSPYASDSFTFGGLQNPMVGTGGADQYYWSTTVDDQLYHLEWSDNWTKKNGKSDETVFVLYKEDKSQNSTALDAAVNWYDGWPGAGSDGDNEGNWGYRSKFDDAIMAIVFKLTNIKTYWSN